MNLFSPCGSVISCYKFTDNHMKKINSFSRLSNSPASPRFDLGARRGGAAGGEALFAARRILSRALDHLLRKNNDCSQFILGVIGDIFEKRRFIFGSLRTFSELAGSSSSEHPAVKADSLTHLIWNILQLYAPTDFKL